MTHKVEKTPIAMMAALCPHDEHGCNRLSWVACDDRRLPDNVLAAVGIQPGLSFFETRIMKGELPEHAAARIANEQIWDAKAPSLHHGDFIRVSQFETTRHHLTVLLLGSLLTREHVMSLPRVVLVPVGDIRRKHWIELNDNAMQAFYHAVSVKNLRRFGRSIDLVPQDYLLNRATGNAL